MSDRYRASGREAEFQPGSDGRVLRNRLGIAVPDEMDEVEMFLLEKLYEQVFGGISGSPADGGRPQGLALSVAGQCI